MIKPVQPMLAGGGLYLLRDLAPGQVVRLQLVEPGINGGIVSLGGRLHRATGVLPTRSGEHFWALVEKVGADQITVRHISPGQSGRGEAGAADLVRALGLPVGEDTERVIRELMRWRLPVDPESVLRILAQGRELPQAGRQVPWPVLVWLQTLDVGSSTGALARILAYLLGRPDAEPEAQEQLNRARHRAGQESVQALALNAGERLQGDVFILTGGREESPDPGARLVLRCRSTAFGEFWICLDFGGPGGLGGKLVTAEERMAGFFRGAVTQLEERLAALGYRVQPFTVETRRVDSVVDFMDGSRLMGYAPLDIRV